MSRPVYEPSYARTDRKLGFSADQLFRRPPPFAQGTAIYEIKVFQDDVEVATGDDLFVWEIPEDLDQAAVVKVEAYISTAGGSGTTIEIRAGGPCVAGTDILSTPITIDTGECNSKDAGTQPVVINPTVVSWGDHLHIDVDAAGSGAMGLGVIVTLAPAALASVVLQGAQGAAGAPGGITAWTGQWSSATTYATNEAVSNNGSSYAAITGSTNVEPGVDAGWETSWQLLASGAAVASYGTALPGGPSDGDEYVLVDSTTAPTYTWRFRYNSGSASSYKWEFIGGSPHESVVTTLETAGGTAGAWQDLATVGPTFTLPNAGDWMFEYLANCSTGGTGFDYFAIGTAVGATSPTVFTNVVVPAASYSGFLSGFRRSDGHSASDAIRLRYFCSNNTNNSFNQRRLLVTPVRII